MQRIVRRLSDFKDKPVAVVGLGKSGIAVSQLLCSLGARLIINDKKNEEEIAKEVVKLSGKIEKIIGGGHPEKAFENVELIIVSPGVPLSTPSIVSAVYRGI
ncbi:MAG: hypothetical protein NZ845_04690, partial [Thermodesulfovibrio sp.]|nr:hypothetical protein [Thermodesulfovibrio sp.]